MDSDSYLLFRRRISESIPNNARSSSPLIRGTFSDFCCINVTESSLKSEFETSFTDLDGDDEQMRIKRMPDITGSSSTSVSLVTLIPLLRLFSFFRGAEPNFLHVRLFGVVQKMCTESLTHRSMSTAGRSLKSKMQSLNSADRRRSRS